jgi:dienelactone hydrolase
MLGDNKAYVTGTSKSAAILIIHDIFGWTFTNMRLLADHFATEADATVYLVN